MSNQPQATSMSPTRMTPERFKELSGLIYDPAPRGFRREFTELLEETTRLRRENDRLRHTFVSSVGDVEPLHLAEFCEQTGRSHESPLHAKAGAVIRELVRELAAAQDAAADAVERAATAEAKYQDAMKTLGRV
jgi:hypothetical protein